MADTSTFAVIGAGLAGATAAAALREEGFEGRLVLLGAEPYPPYERPPLSKGYLLGNTDHASLFVQAPSWYADQQVDLRLTTPAVAVDTSAHEVVLDTDERLGYDKLLLATGASPRRLTVPGADLVQLHYLRTLDDSDRLRASLLPGARIVIIGGGWIGLETAAAARTAGADVVLLERGTLPLAHLLGQQVAGVFADLHRDHGVDLRCGVRIAAIRPVGPSRPDAGVVILSDGTEIHADLLVVGVGVTPNAELARNADLAVDDGIVVDAQLRTTDPDIFAAGDVANAAHPLLSRHVRVEHWANALHQPRTAARTMLGRAATYDRLPYFFSDQYDLGMEYTGHAVPGQYDRVVIRGDLASGTFIAFWLAHDRVLAGMNVNTWDVTDTITELILAVRPVRIEELADPDVPLTELASADVA